MIVVLIRAPLFFRDPNFNRIRTDFFYRSTKLDLFWPTSVFMQELLAHTQVIRAIYGYVLVKISES